MPGFPQRATRPDPHLSRRSFYRIRVAVLLVLRTPELSGLARRLPGGQRYIPVPSTIAPEIAEADQVTQAVDTTLDVAERPSARWWHGPVICRRRVGHAMLLEVW